MKAKDVLGRRGELLAADFLEDRGIRVIDHNWRCRNGEIDIVAVDGQTLVIVEVKTRRSLRYGHPFESITAAKLARLRTLSVLWVREHHIHMPELRIDAMAIIDDGKREPLVEHLKAVG